MVEPVAITEILRGYLKENSPGRDRLYPLLEWNTPGVYKFWDDFDGDTIDGRWQTHVNGTGAAALAIATGELNGVATLNAGSANDGHSAASLGLHFRADHNPVFIARVHLDTAVTNTKVELGFTDVVAGTDVGAVNVLGTLSSTTANDFAVWAVDTDDTTLWQGVSADGGTSPAKYEPSALIGPTADTYETFIVALQQVTGTNVAAARYIRMDANMNNVIKDSGWIDEAISSNVLLTPWIFIQNRSAAGHTLDLDFVGAWQRRSTA